MSLKKLFLVVLLLLETSEVWAQIADLSYSSDEVSTNPAVIGQREIRLFGVAISQESEKASAGSLSREVSLSKSEFIYAKAKSNLVPEVYIHYGTGKLESKNQITDSTTSLEQALLIGQFSLATSISRVLQVGLQYVHSLDFTGNGSGGELYGVGARIELSSSLSMGSYWRHTPSHNKSSTADVDQWAAGISYLSGNPQSSSLRLEVSYGQMTPIMPESTPPEFRITGEVISTGIEFSTSNFLGGVHVQQLRGVFFDIRNSLKDNLYSVDRPLNDQTLSYEAFFALRSKKGHSFGISGLFAKGPQEIYLSGNTTDAEVATATGRISYAYRF